LLFIVNMPGAAHGDDYLKKLGRGICNLVTFPFEIPLQISRVNNSDGPMAAVTYGMLKGVGMTIVRAYVGAYEVVTFPFPVPKYFRPILTDPEFMFEEKSW
ncbi:MAG: exosortase system-associated protein, TIGR04073 family, partial [Candidatus Omnitrophota bacterium]|nr:exosortase system-associated protein, TIGR04073 family [Candidatus Omnitrophota bacterium]